VGFGGFQKSRPQSSMGSRADPGFAIGRARRSENFARTAGRGVDEVWAVPLSSKLFH